MRQHEARFGFICFLRRYFRGRKGKWLRHTVGEIQHSPVCCGFVWATGLVPNSVLVLQHERYHLPFCVLVNSHSLDHFLLGSVLLCSVALQRCMPSFHFYQNGMLTVEINFQCQRKEIEGGHFPCFKLSPCCCQFCWCRRLPLMLEKVVWKQFAV